MSPPEPNPYAPPQDEREVRAAPQESTGTITCVVLLEVDDLAAGLTLTSGKVRWLVPALFGGMGLVSGAPMGTAWQIGEALGFGALGWMLWPLIHRMNARRSLANKSELERTVTFTFSPEFMEVNTATTYSRVKWPGVHRFVEGRKSFILYLGEAMVQVIPKRALRSADVEALRAMFTSRIAPRKKPATTGRALALWFLLIVMFLMIWQFLQPGR